MTDLHCHILPGIDDGAKTVSDSMELLRREAQDGVTNIALTSHFNSERVSLDAFLQKREDAWRALNAALENDPFDIQFKLGAEVYFSPKLCDLDARKLCMGDTAYLLVELPTSHRPHFIRETFSRLQAQGVFPIVAHVERYPYVMEDPTLLYDWIAAGAYAQVNAGALLKENKAARQLLKFISWNLIHVISTDTHSLDKRPPQMKSALRLVSQKLGAQTAHELIDNGDELFRDQELNSSDPHRPKKVLNMWL